MIRRFTIVGGGSAYAPGLLAALIHHRESLSLEEIRLHDLDAGRLETVTSLGQRMSQAAGAGFTVTASTDLLETLRDTDAVLNTTRPGGFECRRIDETLPLEFGCPGQETVGPGGFFFALRSVPAALALVRAIEQVAPNALLLNYTNPTNVVTQALTGRTPISVLGLCDQSDEDLGELCRALSVEPVFQFSSIGLNHAVWYADLELGGAPLPASARSAAPPPELAGEYRLRFELSVELARRHPGFWPSSYLPYYYWPERFVEMARSEGPRTDAIVPKLDGYFAHFREEATREVPELKHHRGSSGFGDLAVRVLRALSRAIGTPIVVNVQNLGIAPELRNTTVVEAVSYVSSAGIIRKPAPRLPPDELPLLARIEAYQHATAEAALSSDPQLAVAALAENPLVPSMESAKAMFERAKRLYGPAVPMFA